MYFFLPFFFISSRNFNFVKKKKILTLLDHPFHCEYLVFDQAFLLRFYFRELCINTNLLTSERHVFVHTGGQNFHRFVN